MSPAVPLRGNDVMMVQTLDVHITSSGMNAQYNVLKLVESKIHSNKLQVHALDSSLLTLPNETTHSSYHIAGQTEVPVSPAPLCVQQSDRQPVATKIPHSFVCPNPGTITD